MKKFIIPECICTGSTDKFYLFHLRTNDQFGSFWLVHKFETTKSEGINSCQNNYLEEIQQRTTNRLGTAPPQEELQGQFP